MRKTLEIIGIVLGILASLIAIVVFFSGHTSLGSFFTPSTPTPAPIPSPAPDTSTHSPFAFPYAPWVWFCWMLPTVISSVSVSVVQKETVGTKVAIIIIGVPICVIALFLIDLLIGFVFNNPEAGFVVSMVFVALIILGTIGGVIEERK